MRRTDRKIDKMQRNLGGLGNSMGELVETLIAARLWEKFAGYPYSLNRAYQRVPVYGEGNRVVLTDIDILLLDGEWAMAVEVELLRNFNFARASAENAVLQASG